MIVTLTTLAWLGLECWLLVRDGIRGKGGTALDRGTRTVAQLVTVAAAVGAGVAHGLLQHDHGWQLGPPA